jgi:hypothetical protein
MQSQARVSRLVDGACPTPVVIDWSDEIRVGGLALFVACAVYWCAGLAWFFRRRHSPWLAHRDWRLATVSSLGCLCQVVSGPLFDFVGLLSIPCDVNLFLVYGMVPLAAGPVVVRILQFYTSAGFQREQLKRGGEASSLDTSFVAQASSVLRYCLCARRDDRSAAVGAAEREPARQRSSSSSALAARALYALSSGRFAALVTTLYAVTCLLPQLVQLLLPTSAFGGKGCYGCDVKGSLYVPVLIQLALVCIPSVFLLVKLRGVPDPLRIMRELHTLCAIGCLILLVSLVHLKDPGSVALSGRFDWRFLNSLLVVAIFTVQCPWQVLQSYRVREAKTPQSEKTGVTELKLAQVLASPHGRDLFRKYLATEFSLENLLFLEAVAKYKEEHATGTVETVRQRAVELLNTFILPSAELELNVSAATSRAVREALCEAGLAQPGGSQRDLLKSRNNVLAPSAPIEHPTKQGKKIAPHLAKAQLSAPPLDVFDRAVEQIRNLMETDSFPRFTRSAFFAQLNHGANV